MALRIIEAHVPPDLSSDAQEVLAALSHESWVQEGGRFGAVVLAVLGAERTGEAEDRTNKSDSAPGLPQRGVL